MAKPNPNPTSQTKVLEIGKFYFIHDGSKTGHPGYIVWKDDEKNIYVALKFGTSKNNENILLTTKISLATRNYIYKKLFVGKRKDFSSKALNDFFITDEIRSLFNVIRNNKPIYSKNISHSVKVNIKSMKIKK